MYGFPCTDISVAGNQQGMKNDDGSLTRSGLFYEATRIVRLAQRHGCRWFVFENVPGLLSNDHGRTFAEVVREITRLSFPVPAKGWKNTGVVRNHVPGEWQFAWRTLNSEWSGVPQRRHRVFACGHLGSWRSSAEVLFEANVLHRTPPESKAKGQAIAIFLEEGAGVGGRTGKAVAAYGGGNCQGPISTATCVSSHHKRCDFDSETFVVEAVAFKPSHYTRSKDGAPSEVHPPKEADADKGDQDPVILAGATIRRLLPIETERLMALPDGWTDVPHRDKPASDSARYRAIGNSICVHDLSWVGQRIQMVNDEIEMETK
jgi:DNA (cytosine-5)-methyltransferase 1